MTAPFPCENTNILTGIITGISRISVIVPLEPTASITDALGVPEKHITLVQVPGALEVPVALMAMAEKLKYDALIALGCIIRGETYHFELVANESGAGVSRVALDF